jgi:hypothetical protein
MKNDPMKVKYAEGGSALRNQRSSLYEDSAEKNERRNRKIV